MSGLVLPIITVTPDKGKPYLIQPRQSDMARLERDIDRAYSRIEIGYDAMFRLAHLALIREGKEVPDLDVFMDTASIEWGDRGEE